MAIKKLVTKKNLDKLLNDFKKSMLEDSIFATLANELTTDFIRFRTIELMREDSLDAYEKALQLIVIALLKDHHGTP